MNTAYIVLEIKSWITCDGRQNTWLTDAEVVFVESLRTNTRLQNRIILGVQSTHSTQPINNNLSSRTLRLTESTYRRPRESRNTLALPVNRDFIQGAIIANSIGIDQLAIVTRLRASSRYLLGASRADTCLSIIGKGTRTTSTESINSESPNGCTINTNIGDCEAKSWNTLAISIDEDLIGRATIITVEGSRVDAERTKHTLIAKEP